MTTEVRVNGESWLAWLTENGDEDQTSEVDSDRCRGGLHAEWACRRKPSFGEGHTRELRLVGSFVSDARPSRSRDRVVGPPVSATVAISGACPGLHSMDRDWPDWRFQARLLAFSRWRSRRARPRVLGTHHQVARGKLTPRACVRRTNRPAAV